MVTEPINEAVGLIRPGFLAVGLFLGRKSKISQEQNVKEFQFYIRMPNFRLLSSLIKKNTPKVADPLKEEKHFYEVDMLYFLLLAIVCSVMRSCSKFVLQLCSVRQYKKLQKVFV